MLLSLFYLLSEILVDKSEDCCAVLGPHGLLELVHLEADVVANLNGLFFVDLELFARSVLKDGFARFAGAFDLFAPFLMLFYLRKENQFFTGVTNDLDDLEEFLKNVAAWTNSQDAWALEGAILLPARDALLAEKLPAVVTLHWIL